MDNNIGLEARTRVENYRKSLNFLEGLSAGGFTYADYAKSIRIAGIDMSESELQEQWRMAEMTIPGPESLRQTQIDVLRQGIQVFTEVAQKFATPDKPMASPINKPSKKWWQFWK